MREKCWHLITAATSRISQPPYWARGRAPGSADACGRLHSRLPRVEEATFPARVQDRARVRARFLDDLSVASLALLVVGPHGAGDIVVVAIAPCADGSTMERKDQHCDTARHFIGTVCEERRGGGGVLASVAASPDATAGRRRKILQELHSLEFRPHSRASQHHRNSQPVFRPSNLQQTHACHLVGRAPERAIGRFHGCVRLRRAVGMREPMRLELAHEEVPRLSAPHTLGGQTRRVR